MPPFALPDIWTGRAIPDAAESVAAFKALILRLDDEDEEKEQKVRMSVEADAERRIGRALNGQQRALMERIREYDNPADWMRLDLEITLQALRNDAALQAAIQRALALGVDLGVSVSLSQLERIGIGFDYTLVHADARDWASQYGYGLVNGINQTSERLLRQAITTWIDAGLSLADLRQDLIPVFGERRVSLIAATEVTRAYAQGTLLGYRQAGYGAGNPTEEIPKHPGCRCWYSIEFDDDGTAWFVFLASNDERTCPRCGPLHGQRIGMAGRGR
jgi:hypothetical protein